jgi:5-methylcytosine-specific restriction endonuclease McrA
VLKIFAGCFNAFDAAVIGRGRGRCPECARSKQKAYDARRPSGWKRYNAAYRKARAQLIAAHPYCSTPGCGSTASLEVDHVVPSRRAARTTSPPGSVPFLQSAQGWREGFLAAEP